MADRGENGSDFLNPAFDVVQVEGLGDWLVFEAHRLLYHSDKGSRTF